MDWNHRNISRIAATSFLRSVPLLSSDGVDNVLAFLRDAARVNGSEAGWNDMKADGMGPRMLMLAAVLPPCGSAFDLAHMLSGLFGSDALRPDLVERMIVNYFEDGSIEKLRAALLDVSQGWTVAEAAVRNDAPRWRIVDANAFLGTREAVSERRMDLVLALLEDGYGPKDIIPLIGLQRRAGLSVIADARAILRELAVA